MKGLYRGSNKEDEIKEKYFKLSIILFIPPVAYLLVFIIAGFNLDGIIYVVPIFLFGCPGAYYLTKYIGINSKLNKEKNKVKSLDLLDSRYKIFTNVNIEYEDKIIEIDNIVIGESGVYIVEAKNSIMKIPSNKDLDYWFKNKILNKSKRYKTKLKNQIKDLDYKKDMLSKYLKEKEIEPIIDGLIYFSNREENMGSRNIDNIFFDDIDLIEYINKKEENKSLDKEITEKIVGLFKELV